jgi:hypothetical protein
MVSSSLERKTRPFHPPRRGGRSNTAGHARGKAPSAASSFSLPPSLSLG